MGQDKTATRNHYVPQFLLRQWRTGISTGMDFQFSLDERTKELIIRRNVSEKSVCFERNLFSFSEYTAEPDLLEKGVFSDIDNKGAKVLAKLLNRKFYNDPHDREIWCGFIVSLVVRRIFLKYRDHDWPAVLREKIDGSEELNDELKRAGLGEKASDFIDSRSPGYFYDKPKVILAGLALDLDYRRRLNSAEFMIVNMRSAEQKLITSDQPLICPKHTDDRDATWSMALSPNHLWIASVDPKVLDALAKETPQRLAKKHNTIVASAANRRVFSTQISDAEWLAKYLARP